MQNLSKKEKGFLGEERVVNFLIEKNYKILSRNWRTRLGEIDIIALDKNPKGDILVFVEVKTLPSGNSETLLKELNARKLKRIIKTSKCFLTKYRQYSNNYIRFDVIVIDMPGFPEVYHIENAFSEFL